MIRMERKLGAGSGLWTQHLAAVLGGECPITAIPSVTVAGDLKGRQFDYIASRTWRASRHECSGAGGRYCCPSI
jgi:hypothetical protein